MADPNYPIQYDAQYGRYYRMQYDHTAQNWVFLDWLPVTAAPQPTTSAATPAPAKHRRDSHHNHRAANASASNAAAATATAANSNQRTREGNTVQGTYNTNHPVPYEKLDPSYCVRDRKFFKEGRMFSILFTEPAGENAVRAMNRVTDYNSAISRVKYDEYVFTQVRRFIVVRHRHAHCYAVPIFSYSNQGTLKSGVVAQEHAIAYSYGYSPQLLDGEEELSKQGICIVMNDGEPPLSRASRIYFGIHHPIQYNVKVKDLGYVHPEWMPAFLGYWNMENASGTLQAPEVTTEAAQSVIFEPKGKERQQDDDDDEGENSTNRLAHQMQNMHFGDH